MTKEALRTGAPHFLLSLLLPFYVRFILIPFGEQHQFFNENTRPAQETLLPYLLMTVPIFLGYVLFLLWQRKKLVFLCCLHDPLILLNLYMGAFACLLLLGGAVLWLMVLSLPVFLAVLLAAFCSGLRKDIARWRKN